MASNTSDMPKRWYFKGTNAVPPQKFAHIHQLDVNFWENQQLMMNTQQVNKMLKLIL